MLMSLFLWLCVYSVPVPLLQNGFVLIESLASHSLSLITDMGIAYHSHGYRIAE